MWWQKSPPLLLLIILQLLQQTYSEQRLAIVSVATPDYVEKHALGILSKECYAMKNRNVDFLLRVPSVQELEDSVRSSHWFRIKILNETLPRYDWIFYTDVDTFLTNPNIKLETFVQKASREINTPFLIVQDGIEINSGGFLIRNTKSSFNFLQEWWDMYDESKNWRFSRTTYDQVPFFRKCCSRLTLHSPK